MVRLFTALLALAVVSTAAADDWPQFLGPRRDASTTEKVQPWKGELKVTWRQTVGEGHSSPVVANGRVYLHTRERGKESEAVDCFDAASGKPLWHYSYPRRAFQGLFGSGPRTTPSLADGKVYSLGPTGILTCLEAATGKKIWQVDAEADFKAPTLKFGVSASPLIVGNKVVVAVGAKDASVVAFDKDSGKVLWKSLSDGASYASPLLVEAAKDAAVVVLTQKGLVGLRPVSDGQSLWSFPFQDKLLESSTTPVWVGDKLLVSSITLGTALVDVKTDPTKPTSAWFMKNLTCYFSTPVTVGRDHVYLVTGGLGISPSSVLHCVDPKTGATLWSKGPVGKFHASLIRTGDNKLLMVEENGSLVLIDPDPKGYRELARASICGQTWAHPAIANGKLYIRDDKELVCVDLGP